MMVVANFIFHRCPQQSLLRNMLFLWNVMWHSPQEAESPFFPMESGLAYDSRPVVSEARSWKVPLGSLGSLAPGTQSLCCEEAPTDTWKGPRRCSRGHPAEVPAAARPASAVSKRLWPTAVSRNSPPQSSGVSSWEKLLCPFWILNP